MHKMKGNRLIRGDLGIDENKVIATRINDDEENKKEMRQGAFAFLLIGLFFIGFIVINVCVHDFVLDFSSAEQYAFLVGISVVIPLTAIYFFSTCRRLKANNVSSVALSRKDENTIDVYLVDGACRELSLNEIEEVSITGGVYTFENGTTTPDYTITIMLKEDDNQIILRHITDGDRAKDIFKEMLPNRVDQYISTSSM